jgi:hypothetical protein
LLPRLFGPLLWCDLNFIFFCIPLINQIE